MKIVAWVPIKMNNERLPGKNVLPLGGKPLCQHVLGELLKLDGIDGVYAFCSDAELDKYLPEGVTRMQRDESLNSFQTKINDVILAFAKAVDADVYVYAQVTSPFLKMESIARGVEAVVSGEYDSALSVKILRDFLWEDKKQPMNYDPAHIARTQDLAPFWQETGGFYIYRKELIEQYHRRTGFKPYLVEISEIEAVDIDYREDYELAQSIILKDFGRTNDIYNVAVLDRWAAFAENGGLVSDFFEYFGYDTCAIYGAGVLGQHLFRSLQESHVEVKYFIDKKRRDDLGVPCILPEDAPSAEPVGVIVITPGFDEAAIRKTLRNLPARLAMMDELLIEWWKRGIEGGRESLRGRGSVPYAVNARWWEAAFDEYKIIFDNFKNHLGERDAVRRTSPIRRHLAQKDVILPLIDLIITTKCTLKCKKCFHLIPSYTEHGRHPFDIDMAVIEKDLRKLLSAVDYIVKVNVLGGEPFLYPNFHALLKKLLAFQNVGYFHIVSNGTLLPSDEVCQVMKDERIFVYVNHYDVPASKTKEIAKKLDDFHINYAIGEDRVWYDFGDLRKRNLSADELKENYSRCSYARCKALMDGELHTCAFHKHGQRNGLLPDAHDSLRLHDCTAEELRERLIAFCNRDYFDACDYCMAPVEGVSREIPAAEQMP